MKTLLKSIKITLVFCVFFSVFYILVLWLFAQVAGPNRGNAERSYLKRKSGRGCQCRTDFYGRKIFLGTPLMCR